MAYTANRLARAPEVVNNAGIIPASFVNPRVVSLSSVGIPDDATIIGTGPSDFGNSYYGTLTLTAGPYAGQTVTQAIQHVLDLAASGPLEIIWDVRCSIGVQGVPGLSGDELLSALTLRNPGRLKIRALPGCGAILRAGCNSAMFTNETHTFGTITSGGGTDEAIAAIGGIAFGGVTFEGLYLNANSGLIAPGYGSSVNQAHPTFGQTFYLNIMRLFGVQDITFRDCSFVGAGGFHLYFGNWQRIVAAGCTIDSFGAGYNGTLLGGNDCFHINGPGDRFTIRDCLLATEDDYIACNTADGNNNSGRNHGPSAPAWGSITRVHAYNTRSTRSNTLGGNWFRVITCGGCVNDGHVFDGLEGLILGAGLIDNSAVSGATSGPAGSVKVSGLQATFARPLTVGESSTATTIAYLSISDVAASPTAPTIPLVSIGTGSTISLLKISDSRTSSMVDLVGNAGTITLALVSSTSMAGANNIFANTGTITKAVVSNCDPALVSSIGFAPATTKGDFYL